MSDRHEIFEELEAFDPCWVSRFDTIKDAAIAASEVTPYVMNIYLDYLQTPEGKRYQDYILSAPDIRGAIRAAQKAEQDSPEFQTAMARMNSRSDGVSY